VKHKSLILLALIIAILYPCNVIAADDSTISWKAAVERMDKYNSMLLNMTDSEIMAKRQYDASLISSKIDPDGISLNFMGYSYFYEYSSTVKLYMTQRKELFPEQMKFSWEMAKGSKEVTRNSMISGLRGLYLGLYNSDNDLKLKQKKIDLFETIHKQNKIKHEKGMITDLELEESLYDLLSSELALQAAERNMQNILQSFNSFIGEDLDIQYRNIIFNEKFDEKRLKDLDYYINKALNERLEIVSVQRQLHLLRLKKEIMERFPNNLSATDIKKSYEQLIDDIEDEQIKLEQTLIEVEKNINEAFLDVTAAQKSLISLSKMLDIQRNNLKKVRQRYEAGLISKVMLDQVQLSFEELENNYKVALYDYNTRLLRLENAAGIGPAY